MHFNCSTSLLMHHIRMFSIDRVVTGGFSRDLLSMAVMSYNQIFRRVLKNISLVWKSTSFVINDIMSVMMSGKNTRNLSISLHHPFQPIVVAPSEQRNRNVIVSTGNNRYSVLVDWFHFFGDVSRYNDGSLPVQPCCRVFSVMSCIRWLVTMRFVRNKQDGCRFWRNFRYVVK